MGRPPGSKNKTTKEKAAGAKKPRKAKAKAAEKEAQATSSANSAETSANAEFKRPTADQVVRLAKQIDSSNEQAGEIRESKKEMLDKAVETQHFQKHSFNQAYSWRKRALKDPVKFALEYIHFLSYMDDLKLDEIANQNRGMDFDDGDEGGGEDESGEEAAAAEQQPAPTRGLRVVPGANAPTDSEVPSAPEDEEAA